MKLIDPTQSLNTHVVRTFQNRKRTICDWENVSEIFFEWENMRENQSQNNFLLSLKVHKPYIEDSLFDFFTRGTNLLKYVIWTELRLIIYYKVCIWRANKMFSQKPLGCHSCSSFSSDHLLSPHCHLSTKKDRNLNFIHTNKKITGYKILKKRRQVCFIHQKLVPAKCTCFRNPYHLLARPCAPGVFFLFPAHEETAHRKNVVEISQAISVLSRA